MEITVAMVKELRERTGAGMMDCKSSLQETNGDMEKAIDYLREKGIAKAAAKAGRKTREGIVTAYIHHGDRLGVLLEVSCETDFVARTDDFKTFTKDVAIQVAAMKPLSVSREDLAQDIVERERQIYETQVRSEGKPEKAIDRILEGKLEKFYRESVLLEQPFVKDEDRTINDILIELISKTGENISITRFTRFELGEEG